jgi:hypothetical protein
MTDHHDIRSKAERALDQQTDDFREAEPDPARLTDKVPTKIEAAAEMRRLARGLNELARGLSERARELRERARDLDELAERTDPSPPLPF